MKTPSGAFFCVLQKRYKLFPNSYMLSGTGAIANRLYNESNINMLAIS